MTDSATWLREYVGSGSEEAFGRLVAGHINLVYSAALRVLNGDAHLARDVAQIVFTDLARKAKSLPADVVLSGWLYRHTCFRAANAVRAERRRQAREREAATMQALNEDSEAAWRQLAPVLEEAMACLGTRERDALVLRFFEQRPLRAVGQALGLSEEAARKRVDRALAALRTHLTRRGVVLSATAVAAAISSNAVSAAPVGLSAALTSASLAGTAAAEAGAGTTFLGMLAMTKLQVTVLGLLFVAGVATPVLLNSRAAAPAKASAPEASRPKSAPSSLAHSPGSGPAGLRAASSELNPALARLADWLRSADRPDPNWPALVDELRLMISALAPEDYPRAWALREGVHTHIVRSLLQHEVLRAWSKTEPRIAADAAQLIPTDWRGFDAAETVLWNWGAQDPKAALAWAQTSLPQGMRLSRVCSALNGQSQADPAAALKLSQQLLTPSLYAAMVQRIVDRWASRDPVAAAAAVTQMPPSVQRAYAFGILVRNWKEVDPAAAQQWLDQTSLLQEKQRYLQSIQPRRK
jgi:RNA polymerase sigma factor (sigma-70 family)